MAATAIVDVVDMGDPRLKSLRDSLDGYNNVVVETYPMSNGVGYVVGKIVQILGANGSGRLKVLRFWGHGNGNEPIAYISFGPPLAGYTPPIGSQDNWASIGAQNLPALLPTLLRLKPYFAKDARVEFRQCVFAKFAEGKSIMRQLAQLGGIAILAPEKPQDRGELWVSPIWQASSDGKIRQLGNNEVIEVAARR